MKIVNCTTGEVMEGIDETLPAFPVTSGDVDMERNRRITAGIVFKGKRFQTRPEDRENIMGAYAKAAVAIMMGALPGDLLWHKPEDNKTPFAFIAEDNSFVPMDAYTMIAFGDAVAAQKSYLTFKGFSMKRMPTIPADFADDKHWQ